MHLQQTVSNTGNKNHLDAQLVKAGLGEKKIVGY